MEAEHGGSADTAELAGALVEPDAELVAEAP